MNVSQLSCSEGGDKVEIDGNLKSTAGWLEYDSSMTDLNVEEEGKELSGARPSKRISSRCHPESSTIDRDQHSGISSVSSHSSVAGCLQPLSEKSLLFGLAELLRKTIQSDMTESMLSRKDSDDFISSAQPFMITSRPFNRSIPSSRNSGSRIATRYASLSTTPYYNVSSGHTPGKYGSGRSSPVPATGHSTPLYSSPFNSPRTSGEHHMLCQ